MPGIPPPKASVRRGPLASVDLAIRVSSAVVVLSLGPPMLLLVGVSAIVAFENGTGKAVASSLGFFGGCSVLLALTVATSIFADWFAKFVPGPRIIGNVLVRIPAYIVGTGGMALLIRQIWTVAIPDMLRRH